MSDGEPTDSGHNETQDERYDRNWHDLQQELRITQTGTQWIGIPLRLRLGARAVRQLARSTEPAGLAECRR